MSMEHHHCGSDAAPAGVPTPPRCCDGVAPPSPEDTGLPISAPLCTAEAEDTPAATANRPSGPSRYAQWLPESEEPITGTSAASPTTEMDCGGGFHDAAGGPTLPRQDQQRARLAQRRQAAIRNYMRNPTQKGHYTPYFVGASGASIGHGTRGSGSQQQQQSHCSSSVTVSQNASPFWRGGDSPLHERAVTAPNSGTSREPLDAEGFPTPVTLAVVTAAGPLEVSGRHDNHHDNWEETISSAPASAATPIQGAHQFLSSSCDEFTTFTLALSPVASAATSDDESPIRTRQETKVSHDHAASAPSQTRSSTAPTGDLCSVISPASPDRGAAQSTLSLTSAPSGESTLAVTEGEQQQLNANSGHQPYTPKHVSYKVSPPPTSSMPGGRSLEHYGLGGYTQRFASLPADLSSAAHDRERTLSAGSFLFNTSFANNQSFSDPLAASMAMHQGRTALTTELRRKRQRLLRQIAQLQKEATSHNIFALVRASNASQLQYMLQEKLCKVNERDYNGCAPLHVAASEGNVEIVRVLLSFGADLLAMDNAGRTPLDCAAANRHSAVARYLLALIRSKHTPEGRAAAEAEEALAASLSLSRTATTTAAEAVGMTTASDIAATDMQQSYGGGRAAEVSTASVTQAPGEPTGLNWSNTERPMDDHTPTLHAVGPSQRRLSPDAPSSVMTDAGEAPLPSALINICSASMVAFSAPESVGSFSAQDEHHSNSGDGVTPHSQPFLSIPSYLAGTSTASTENSPINVSSLARRMKNNYNDTGSLGGAAPVSVPSIGTTSADQTVVAQYSEEDRAQTDGPTTMLQPLKELTSTGNSRREAPLMRGRSPAPTFPPTAATSFSDVGIQTLEDYRHERAVVTQPHPRTSRSDGPAKQQLRRQSPVTIATGAAVKYGEGSAAPPQPRSEECDEVHMIPWDDLSYSSFTTVSDTVSLIVCMSGLPGRGKSFISKRLVRYMNWKGVPCRVFNAGDYRRQLLGVDGTAGAEFFDPDNPRGKEMREKMAELACEDLVRFIASHTLAVGILDATNTTYTRRSWLKGYFEKEAKLHNARHRLLFIESVCTDESIITENILRSKCGNDDFKSVKDPSAVIAEFRERIRQYERVYETLSPTEGLSFIKIINVKHHVVLHKVHAGLGSRIAFFLQNLHPVAYPIYISLPGETVSDASNVFGGGEQLTQRGLEYAVALKQFIQDRYVPHLAVLHATNPSVLSTLQPLMMTYDEEGGMSTVVSGSGTTTFAVPPSTFSRVTTPSMRAVPAAAAATAIIASSNKKATPHEGHGVGEKADEKETVMLAGGDLSAIPNAESSEQCNEDDDVGDEEEEAAEEVLCPVPGLDDINYGRFGGRSAVWVAEKYPRLSKLLYESVGDGEEDPASTILSSFGYPSPATATPTGAQQHMAPVHLPTITAKAKEALAWFRHHPTAADPQLAYSVQFPNGECSRQVNVRLEPALMAVMRTQSPVFVVAPPVPAQGILAFFADVIPELSPTLRLPEGCVVEVGVKGMITVHPLLRGAGRPLGSQPCSPTINKEEIAEALRQANSSMIAIGGACESVRAAEGR